MPKEPKARLMEELGPVAEELHRRGEEHLAKQIKKQEEKAKEVTIDYIESSCKCLGCPSYAECGGNLAFCYYGQSKASKITKRKCLCPTCPVKKRLKLPEKFHCINGKSSRFLREAPQEPIKKGASNE